MSKKQLIILSLLFSQFITAQLSISINGKKAVANQEFSYSDIKTMTVSFTNPTKLPTYSDGYVLLSCGFFDESGLKENVKYISKMVEGASSIHTFLNQKVPKEYQLLPTKSEPEFTGNVRGDKYNFASYCETYKASPYGGKVKLKFELSYYELTGWHYGSDNYTRFNEYGEAVELIDPFEITLKIADKNALIPVSTLNTKFSVADLQEFAFEKFDTTSRWNDLGDITGTNSAKPKQTIFKFNDNVWVYSLKLTYPSNDATSNLNDFMNKCNETAFLYTNACNVPAYFATSKHKQKEERAKRVHPWGLKTLLRMSDDRTLQNFNEKTNKNAESESMWVPFTAGKISGYKAINQYRSNTCYDKNNETGRAVIYAFPNPNDLKSILVFTCEDYKQEDPNYLTKTSEFMEKFISKLKF